MTVTCRLNSLVEVGMNYTPKLWTTGKIAADSDSTRETVSRIVRIHHIQHSALAGQTRLFDREAVTMIRFYLRQSAKPGKEREGL